MRHWPLAIHQFQQLPIEDQKTLGNVLSREFQHMSTGNSVDKHIPFPEDVQAIIQNAGRKSPTS